MSDRGEPSIMLTNHHFVQEPLKHNIEALMMANVIWVLAQLMIVL